MKKLLFIVLLVGFWGCGEGYKPVQLDSPNGGEVWIEGNTYTISWDYPSQASKISLSYDSGISWIEIVDGIQNPTKWGSYEWRIGPIYKPRFNCRIKVEAYDNRGQNSEDISENDFNIEPSSDKIINITFPNGYETLHEKTMQEIVWYTMGDIGGAKVHIGYSINGGEEWFDALSNSQNGTTYLPITLNHWYWGGDPAWGSADNSGSYIWTLPNFSESMDSCLLAIWSYEDSYIYGISENYFSITSDSNYYDIDSPNGGEILYSGTEHQILWSSSGDVGDVKIYYSLFGGQSWYLIDDYKANDGSFTWSVPFVQGTNDLCRIKIQSVDRDDWFDISDNNFTISND